jgi:ribosome maturation factor RimP
VALTGRLFAFRQQDHRLDRDEIDDASQLTSLEARITAEIEQTLAHMGYEIVRVAVLGRERPTVQVMADRADGTLIAIEDCERINDVVSATLDVADIIKSAWTLEISSAGIDRPLTRVKDWNRFAGHVARAEVNMPIDGRKRFNGVVLGADEAHARMRLDDGAEVALPLADLRRAKLVLTDALIAATAQRSDDAAPDQPQNKPN